ncbi:MAG: hypothetical protein E7477_05770 [Ruminococcaceae bacterium]|nr:hypothetical protein [Oscillospiraceae bacterium]
MKKIIAILMCLVFTLTIMSCAASEEEIVPDYDSNVSDQIDLDGKTFIYGMVQDYFFEGADSTLGYINTTEFADLAAKRLEEVEDRYNCSIEMKYVTRAGEAAYHSVLTSDYEFDFIQEESFFLVDYVIANIFTDLASLDNIDATNEEKWGNRYLLASTMWNGGIYGVIPALHPLRTQNSMSSVFAVNENHIATLGQTDPRDYYENGEWTYDTFTNVLTNYTFNNLSGDKVYSLAASRGWFTRGMALSNGDEYLTIKDDGAFSLGFYSDTALEAFNQTFEWWNGPTASNIIEGGLDQFVSGQSVLGLIDAYQILSGTTSVAYNVDNFGIVPFPSGPNAEPGWYKSFYEAADFTICIPLTAPDAEASALIIDAIYESFEGYETDESVIEYLSRNYFLDERDSKFFFELSDKDHAVYIDHAHSLSGFFGDITTRSATEVLQGAENLQYTNTEKYILPQYQTIAELYE